MPVLHSYHIFIPERDFNETLTSEEYILNATGIFTLRSRPLKGNVYFSSSKIDATLNS